MNLKEFLKPSLMKILFFLFFLGLGSQIFMYLWANGVSCGRYGCSPLELDSEFGYRSFTSILIMPLGLLVQTWYLLTGKSSIEYFLGFAWIFFCGFILYAVCYLSACFISRRWLEKKKTRRK